MNENYNQVEQDVQVVKCCHCGALTKFDLNKCPINICFDYKCKGCGSFNKIKLIVNDENLIKKYHANFIKNKYQIRKEYFNNNVFTIENKIDSFWEGKAREIGEQIVENLKEKSYHHILVLLSNLNTIEKAEDYFAKNSIVVGVNDKTRKSVIETFVEKVRNCAEILRENNNGGKY